MRILPPSEHSTESIEMNTLGIDLGTSEVKVLLLAANGSVLATVGSKLKWSQPHPGWVEQNPQDWWIATVDACKKIRKLNPFAYAEVAAIGLSGQMHGATVIDKHHHVLRPCILWNDSRSTEQCKQLTNKSSAFHDIGGNLVMPGFTAPKLLWIRDNEPELFRHIAKVLLPKDYLRYLLTGKFVSEMSDAAGTLWLDVARREWSDTLLNATSLSREHMPELVEGTEVSGGLTPEAAWELGLSAGVVVVGGAGDNAASAVGLGAVLPGDSFISLGTSGVLFTVTERHRPNVQETVHAFCHALPGVWHQMTVMLSAASTLQWVTGIAGAADETALLNRVDELPMSERASSPIFLPYLSGERTPHNDTNASGAFVGLRHSHTAAHMAYAVIDGVSLGMRDGLDALRRSGSHVNTLQLVGGGSRSPLWAQLLADALELEIAVGQDSGVGAAIGAARLAQLSQTPCSPNDIDRVCSRPNVLHRYVPKEKGVQLARRRQSIYRSSYQALRGVFAQAAHS